MTIQFLVHKLTWSKDEKRVMNMEMGTTKKSLFLFKMKKH